MVVYLPAQRPAVHADGRRCTNMHDLPGPEALRETGVAGATAPVER
jgi:hypothetical protein